MIKNIIISETDVKGIVNELASIYSNLKNKYKHNLLKKEPGQIGGTYYGSTELLSQVGIHFEEEIAYTDYSAYSSSYYDFVFKVGGKHYDEFKVVKDDFIKDFSNQVDNLLIAKGFTKEKNLYKANINEDDIVEIRRVDNVSYGTNFSTYCGLMISFRYKSDNYFKSGRFNKSVLLQAIKK